MLKFIIPGYYLFYSRLKSRLEKISWFIIYIIPIYMVGLFYISSNIFSYSLLFALSVLIFNSVYEIGYIENDTKTIIKEQNPTLRLEQTDYALFKEKNFTIIVLKVLVASILLFLAHEISCFFSFDVYILRFLLMLVVVRILFYFHNGIRSNANIITFFALAAAKYIAPLFLILPSGDLIASWIITFFIFPLVRAMEHAKKGKYGLNKWIIFIGSLDLFRVKYYGFMLVIVSFIVFVYPIKPVIILLVLIVYFFIYRVASYVLVNNEIYLRK